MDISTLATLLGTIAGSSFVTTQVSNWWQRREKIAERRRMLDDGWRTDLRHAHAQFIASYSKLLSIGSQLYLSSKSLHEQRNDASEAAMRQGADGEQADEVYFSAGNPELLEKTRQTLDAFTAASIEADTRLAEVMLLESNPPIQKLLVAIYESPLRMLGGSEDLERFQADLASKRKLIDDLTRALVGMFSPDRWGERTAARPELLSSSRPELPSGGTGGALPGPRSAK